MPEPFTGRKLALHCCQCPGDQLMLLAALVQLHQQYPGKFKTSVHTPCQDIYKHCPYVSANDGTYERMDMHYNTVIQRSHRADTHFLHAYAVHFNEQLKLNIELDCSAPVIFMSDEEKIKKLIDSDYWIINAGYKLDCETKNYGHDRYQEIVNSLPEVQFVQVGEDTLAHSHKPLKNVINLIGKTNIRELFSLCYHANGGIGPVTFLMHILAASPYKGAGVEINKPYVCLAGGREAVSFTAYKKCRHLSTIGCLPCSQSPCWRSHTTDAGKFKKDCLSVIDGLAECMTLVHPETVVQTVRQFRR